LASYAILACVPSWNPGTGGVLPQGLVCLGAWAADQTSARRLVRDTSVMHLLASSPSPEPTDPEVLLAFPASSGLPIEARFVPLSKVRSNGAESPVEVSIIQTAAGDPIAWMAEAGIQIIR